MKLSATHFANATVMALMSQSVYIVANDPAHAKALAKHRGFEPEFESESAKEEDFDLKAFDAHVPYPVVDMRFDKPHYAAEVVSKLYEQVPNYGGTMLDGEEHLSLNGGLTTTAETGLLGAAPGLPSEANLGASLEVGDPGEVEEGTESTTEEDKPEGEPEATETAEAPKPKTQGKKKGK